MHNPTPWQFLLDLFAKKRIADVVKTGNQEQIANIKKLYENLNENEVVFSIPEFIEKMVVEKSYWKVSFECQGRGFASPAITFRTYPLSAMIGEKANVLTGFPELVKTPGFYVNKETGCFHLIVNKDSDSARDPIEVTGYRFEREYIAFEEFVEFDQVLHADAVIDIKYPQVAGKIYVNYLKPEPVEQIPETQLQDVQDENLIKPQLEETTKVADDETKNVDQGISENQDQKELTKEPQGEVTQKYQNKNKRR
ncbi:hypothetical protein [Aeromonas phage ZPAH34]|uniref:hypothetical protein n=1 Tax=Aeromonas phage ZPAH34 TaxID=2924888 RepID=UPI00232960AE|nr:hypothetical protein PQD16_gp182 [Aeromonas phage ZPAH34]UOX39501.1 hypothetical protein [Aeromonas phage ZPAH34]